MREQSQCCFLITSQTGVYEQAHIDFEELFLSDVRSFRTESTPFSLARINDKIESSEAGSYMFMISIALLIRLSLKTLLLLIVLRLIITIWRLSYRVFIEIFLSIGNIKSIQVSLEQHISMEYSAREFKIKTYRISLISRNCWSQWPVHKVNIITLKRNFKSFK